MRILYQLLTFFSRYILELIALFSSKIKLFVQGRKNVFSQLQQQLSDNDRTIWIHCASLGEYEQGVPVIKELRTTFPNHKLILSFFSPSGYEVKKDSALVDQVYYLPIDSRSHAKKWVRYVHPELVLFVKNEIWPNYLLELQAKGIPVLLISGLFRKNQIYFKPWGGWMRKVVGSMHHLFVQNIESQQLLQAWGINQVTVSGDTRFDRVFQQRELDNQIAMIEQFINQQRCIVIGSSWPEDIHLLLEYINTAPADIKFIIAPHQIHDDKIAHLRQLITKKSVLFSDQEAQHLADYSVLIVDSIGWLSKIYSYADVAYVGGGMGMAGLHNILEPATFGVPIVIGKNYQKFPEAVALKEIGGLFTVSQPEEVSPLMNRLLEPFVNTTVGALCKKFITDHQGATQKIMQFIQKLPIQP